MEEIRHCLIMLLTGLVEIDQMHVGSAQKFRWTKAVELQIKTVLYRGYLVNIVQIVQSIAARKGDTEVPPNISRPFL